jgi:hypothetical protein
VARVVSVSGDLFDRMAEELACARRLGDGFDLT